MNRPGTKFAVCLLAATLWACGPKEDNNKPENNTNANNTNNTTNTNNMPNNGTNNPTNNGTNNPPNNTNMMGDADVAETEPNGFEDTMGWASFEPGETIGGTIATGAGDTSDADVFVVTLSAGTVVQFGFEQLGPGLADTGVILLQDENGEIMTRVAAVSEGPQSRQAYIPVDGNYIVAVYDERAAAEEPQQHGGDDSWYVASLDVAQSSPIAAAVPSSTNGDQSDGSIQIYEVSVDADTAVVADITAVRDPITSSLDSVLFVVDAATNEIVAFNDDIDFESGIYDSRAIFSATAGTTYHVVVDSWYGTDSGAYLLAMSETDDDISAPNPLVVGTPAMGVIDAVDGAEFDTDYFVLSLNPGETARVVVTGAGGLEPAVTAVVDTFFGLIPFATGFAVGTEAAIEFAHPSDAEEAGDYFVLVDDVRNVADPDAIADVGEAGFTYTVDASLTTWTPTPVTLPYTTAGSLPGVGNYVWYSFTIPAGHMFAATATSSNPDFVAGVATLGEGGTAFTEIGSASLFPQAELDITIGVRDQFFRGGAGWDFTPSFQSFDIGAINFTAVAEVEPNDTAATAETPALPAAVQGVLDGAGEADLKPDWFAVTASAGQTIGVYTADGADAGTDPADTVVTIYGSDGTTVIAENDDYDGQDMTFFSAAVASVATAGTYYVVVTPYCVDPDDCSGNGDYTANIFVQ